MDPFVGFPYLSLTFTFFSLTRESLQISNLAVTMLFEAHSGVNLSH